jgi:hypothetical protein
MGTADLGRELDDMVAGFCRVCKEGWRQFEIIALKDIFLV